jgi:hypothetical protein
LVLVGAVCVLDLSDLLVISDCYPDKTCLKLWLMFINYYHVTWYILSSFYALFWVYRLIRLRPWVSIVWLTASPLMDLLVSGQFRLCHLHLQSKQNAFLCLFFPNYLDMLHICFYLQDSKSISAFIAYALCAADEALRDANWLPNETEKKERTVT